MRNLPLILFYVGVAAICLLAFRPMDRNLMSRNFATHASFAAAVRKADVVALYEGLPHQMFEEQLLAEELHTKQTIRLQGYPFYQEPLPLKEADAKQLTELFCNPRSFRPIRATGIYVKACGGFHPDYCIEWRNGDKV